MRTLNAIAKTLMGAALVLTLTACGKTSTSSTASTPVGASNCQWNGTNWVYPGTTNVCNPGTTGTICPANGQYTAPGGGLVYCTAGQPITTYYPPTGYPTGIGSVSVGSCDGYYYQYGVPYVPMYLNGQYVCVNTDYLQGNVSSQYGYYSNPYDSYGYQYYYQYPPYQDGYGGYGCSNSVTLDLGFGGANICF